MDKRYIEVPGARTHELPPLLVHAVTQDNLNFTSVLSEAEDMLAGSDAAEDVVERRKFDLAIQLIERYKGLASYWAWGDSVIEWIRQCEITFESEDALRTLLHPDVWPHPGRASFIELLREKGVPTNGVVLEQAVGLRLIFRQQIPADCFSSQFLMYLNDPVTKMAYSAWAHLLPQGHAMFPPGRFHFDVLNVT